MYNTSVLTWLQTILKERFDQNFRLSSGQNSLEVHVEGNASYIKVSGASNIFKQDVLDLPCTKYYLPEEWDPLKIKYLVAPGVDKTTESLVEKTDFGYLINYNLFSLAYWMLSRKEEVDGAGLDEFDRFPATSSHAYRHGYLERPVVDEWFELLRSVILRTWPNLYIKKNEFRTLVSHDVDSPSRYAFSPLQQLPRAVLRDFIKHRTPTSPFFGPFIYAFTKARLLKIDPLNNFDWIMDVSERNNIRSAFYFICGRTDSARDGQYEIEHPAIRYLLKNIYQRGHEIGLHPSFNTYLCPELIAKEAARLRSVCAEEHIEQATWGGRMHYLRWKHPITLHGWEQASFNYDSTLGYADLPGFRCGTCFEYPAFDPVLEKPLNLRIRPLIAMESSIIASRYLGLGVGEESFRKFKELKSVCQRVGGSFTLLWHNSELVDPKMRRLYESVLSFQP